MNADFFEGYSVLNIRVKRYAVVNGSQPICPETNGTTSALPLRAFLGLKPAQLGPYRRSSGCLESD